MVPAPGSEVAAAPRRRLRIRVEGIVQGVGFRPYLYRLAGCLGLAGHARNDTRGVLVEVEGAPAGVAEFLARLEPEAPPLAAIESVSSAEIAPAALAEPGFRILESDDTGPANALVAADVATCDACLRELFDPADRRYRYPFVNCTHCGPRFTIIQGIPYDRPLTTMARFTMCPACRSEYEDPADRRFHAQPNACPACGPRVWVERAGAVEAACTGVGAAAGDCTSDGMRTGVDAGYGEGAATAATSEPPAADDPIRATATALRAGAIVALKGLGGFHLACLARDPAAVRTLRERKRRPAKPFALMAPDLAGARRLIVLDAAEEALLRSRERPIVLARRRAEAAVAPGVAPGQLDLGVMLPYTPLHHLLLAELGEALVMTSGNLSDEPIAYSNDDALARLFGIADLFLLHDRPIRLGVDDSVARVVSLGGERRPQLIRRARGYAPRPLPLPVPAPRPLLACGGQLKNTFCLARGGRAWPSHHIGDLGEYETLRAFGDGVAHLESLCGIRPEVLAHDLHPEYLATKYAVDRVAQAMTASEEARASWESPERGSVHRGPAERELADREPRDGAPQVRAPQDRAPLDPLGVQHHHAHLVACLAEHGETGPALGVIFDGTGYGPDGTVWGGEFLLGDLTGYERVAHLHQVRLPGGEAAIREPWRIACAWLVAAGEEEATTSGTHQGSLTHPVLPTTLAGAVDPARWAAVARLARSGTAAPLTSSMGRLFDAVAALCGLGAVASYEGEAAIALEAAIDPEEPEWYEIPVVAGGSPAGMSVSGPSTAMSTAAPTISGSEASIRDVAPLTLDARPLIRAVVAELAAGTPVKTIAACFHNALARATTQLCTRLAERHGTHLVVLSGGVFQNRALLERSAAELARVGLRVLTAERIPPNDGGIAYGQAAIAAARSHAESSNSLFFTADGAPKLRPGSA